MCTHHRVAELEHLTEQYPTLPFGKGLPERAQAAGVSDIRAVHTLMRHPHRAISGHMTLRNSVTFGHRCDLTL